MPDTRPEDLIRQLRSLAEDFADVHHLTQRTGLLDDDAILMPLIARIRTTQSLTNKAITLTLAVGDSTTGSTTAGRSAIAHLTGAARRGNDAGGHLLAAIPAATALYRTPRSAPRPPRTPRTSAHHLALRRHSNAATNLLWDTPVICLDAAALITATLTTPTTAAAPEALPRLTDPQRAAFRLISQGAVRIRQREGQAPLLDISVPAPTITATVEALERKKLVTRDTSTSPDDGQKLVLTTVGQSALPAIVLRTTAPSRPTPAPAPPRRRTR
ncbi:hypothetical protein [Streptomyces sp. 4R-3d]|uniref:hypothetical protein n=1 Tax=Streptomyces sp. 4R-3d TaxID=2559605 RepID=UPI0010727763|nr:hypothetical protein [Streptomyces sp. 4R-3d]TFI21342.1 hypothetical protein E4P36_33750 [Streptomyces sp. 4R-3d]